MRSRRLRDLDIQSNVAFLRLPLLKQVPFHYHFTQTAASIYLDTDTRLD